MRNITRLSVRLFLICAVAAFLVGITDYVTRDPIRERREINALLAGTYAYPGLETTVAVNDALLNELQNRIGDVVKAVKWVNDDQQGVIIELSVPGDQGKIDLSIGISADMVIQGIYISDHKETPGLGGHITNESFLSQYIGITERVSLKRNGGNIDGISGATHSSEAVNDAVNTALLAAGIVFGGG